MAKGVSLCEILVLILKHTKSDVGMLFGIIAALYVMMCCSLLLYYLFFLHEFIRGEMRFVAERVSESSG
jgi:hypothetical protein